MLSEYFKSFGHTDLNQRSDQLFLSQTQMPNHRFQKQCISDIAWWQAMECIVTQIDDRLIVLGGILPQCKGRVVIRGHGVKSGHIGRKMAATFASTGTPSFFMHLAKQGMAFGMLVRGDGAYCNFQLGGKRWNHDQYHSSSWCTS